MTHRLLVIASAVVFMVLPVIATAVSPNQMTLKNLKTGERNVIIPGNELATIAMVYQPDCSWCKKQEQLLRIVQEQCGNNVNLALIGNKGNVRELKRELKHFDKVFPAYRADKTFLRTIGGIAASPTTLFFDKNGKVLAKKRGYIPPDKFFSAVNIITNNRCII